MALYWNSVVYWSDSKPWAEREIAMYLKGTCSHAHVERSEAHKLQPEPSLKNDLIHACCALIFVACSFLQDLADGDNGFISYHLWQQSKLDSKFITENIMTH